MKIFDSVDLPQKRGIVKGGVETTTQQENEEAHPLSAKPVSLIGSWAQWKELWEKESRTELLHSLLHFGFEVSTKSREDEIERVCLYLDIADGCFDFFKFGDPEPWFHYQWEIKRFDRTINSPSELKSALGQKAFHMLCQGFFKNTAKKEDYPPSMPSWMRLAIDPRVFSKILWFFRLDENGHISNLWHAQSSFSNAKKREIEIAKEFIQKFCLLAWEYDETELGKILCKDDIQIFKQALPSMIEILFGLRKLDALLIKNRYADIDENCLKKIEGLALAFNLWFGAENRKPRTIEEACLIGSQAAQTWLILRAMQKAARSNKRKE